MQSSFLLEFYGGSSSEKRRKKCYLLVRKKSLNFPALRSGPSLVVQSTTWRLKYFLTHPVCLKWMQKNGGHPHPCRKFNIFFTKPFKCWGFSWRDKTFSLLLRQLAEKRPWNCLEKVQVGENDAFRGPLRNTCQQLRSDLLRTYFVLKVIVKSDGNIPSGCSIGSGDLRLHEGIQTGQETRSRTDHRPRNQLVSLLLPRLDFRTGRTLGNDQVPPCRVRFSIFAIYFKLQYYTLRIFKRWNEFTTNF